MISRSHFNHGKLLRSKSTTDQEVKKIYDAYLLFISNISTFKVTDEQTLIEFVNEFNKYRNAVLYTIENRKNSGQESFRSSMLEELFCHLFSDLVSDILPAVPNNFFMGKANSYVDLTFSPASFKESFLKPNPYIHSKDQDFVLGITLQLKISSDNTQVCENIIVPILAIECKTYIERNMLDSCAGTARRLKSAMPYCLYIVASEYMKLKDEQPELSDINEIYILCKSSVGERSERKRRGQNPQEIYPDLIIDLFNKVKGHLNSIWWAPEKALTTGKVINRP